MKTLTTCAREGLDVEIGTARFVGKQDIGVTHHDETNARTSAKTILLCTGSIQQPLKAEGINKVEIYTNQTIFAGETTRSITHCGSRTDWPETRARSCWTAPLLPQARARWCRS